MAEAAAAVLQARRPLSDRLQAQVAVERLRLLLRPLKQE